MSTQPAEQEESTENYDCPTCGKPLDTEHGLKCHHTRVHGEPLEDPVTVECEHCETTFEEYPYKAERDEKFFCDEDCKYAWKADTRGQVVCDNCGDVFARPPSDQGDHNFCGEACYEEWREADRIDVECAYCGAELSRTQSRLDACERPFCDDQCRSDWLSENRSGPDHPDYNQVTVECATCGTEIQRRPSTVQANENCFCGMSCYQKWCVENVAGENHPHWEGGEVDYGDGWTKQKREQVRDRDNRACQGCGLSESKHQVKHGERLHVHHIVPARQVDDPVFRNAMENLVALCRSCHREWEQMAPLRPVTGTE